MTDSEKQIIIDAVIQALRTNSRTIEQLTPVVALSLDDYFEVNGGRRIAYSALKALFEAISANDRDKLLVAIERIKSVLDEVGKPGGLATLDKNGKVPDSQMGDKYRNTADRYAESWKSYLETSGTDYSEGSISLGMFHQGPDDDIESRELDILAATHEAAGVMSAADKRKLDGIVENPTTVQAMTIEEVMECCH